MPRTTEQWEATPELAYTVERQSACIEQLDTELDAVTSHSLAQGRKLCRQPASSSASVDRP